MKRLAFLCCALLAAPALAQGFDHSHKAWNALVGKHVVLTAGGNASQLRYAELAKDRAALKAYLDALSKVSEAEFRGWSKPQQMAFLINAYNSFTVEKILTRYPNIRSIWDFGKVFGNPFKDKFFTLLGREFSLDGIEHDTLRRPGAYDELRVHFAVNCASIGCPMLREEAYVAERLERQLEEQAVRFLSDRTRNRAGADGKLEVSNIFEWFKVDWTSGYKGYDGRTPPIQSREQYFGRYAKLLTDNPEHQKLVAEGKAPIGILEYDWTLNDVEEVKRLSVIIPALNEAPGIRAALERLQPMRGQGHEIIVADGGSRDGMVDLAAPLADRVVVAARGRARQMNAGARVASGDAFLFLHADTRLAPDAGRLVTEALARGDWGRFDVAIEGEHPLLGVIAAMMNWRSRLTGIATGDQAIFVRREAFEGFPEIALMEDIAFSKAMKRRSPPACLRARVVTSGRRWEERGVLRTMVLMWRLRLMYFLGADPDRLARLYSSRG